MRISHGAVVQHSGLAVECGEARGPDYREKAEGSQPRLPETRKLDDPEAP